MTGPFARALLFWRFYRKSSAADRPSPQESWNAGGWATIALGSQPRGSRLPRPTALEVAYKLIPEQCLRPTNRPCRQVDDRISLRTEDFCQGNRRAAQHQGPCSRKIRARTRRGDRLRPPCAEPPKNACSGFGGNNLDAASPRRSLRSAGDARPCRISIHARRTRLSATTNTDCRADG